MVLFQAAIFAGLFLAYLVGWILTNQVKKASLNWRLMFIFMEVIRQSLDDLKC